jgi:hypothetical protein
MAGLWVIPKNCYCSDVVVKTISPLGNLKGAERCVAEKA